MSDPQPSGGLIPGVRREDDEIVRESRAAGYDEATVIGEVIAEEVGRGPEIRLANRQ